MSMSFKALAVSAGAAFLALTGCASQQSGQAVPQNLPNNCTAYAQAPAPVCKGYNACKGRHGNHCGAHAPHAVVTSAIPPVSSTDAGH
jgi:hypothetical protein